MALGFVLPRSFKDFFAGVLAFFLSLYVFPNGGVIVGIVALLFVWHYFSKDETEIALQKFYDEKALGKRVK